jgi:hypothetical protein
MNMKQDPELEALPEYGNLYTIADFVALVNDGMFIDYDGTGYFATAFGMSRENIARPSFIKKEDYSVPTWATHVMWFNK